MINDNEILLHVSAMTYDNQILLHVSATIAYYLGFLLVQQYKV